MSNKILLVLATAILISCVSMAQTSTEFWFAPPEVTSGHVTDNPVVLRLATAADAATVTIDMPANPTFNESSPIVISMGSYESHTEDLTAFLAEIETGPMDVVLTTGIRIIATTNITAYYEVNTRFNPEIFALKGLTGLGTQFYTPFQDEWSNGGYTPTPYTSFDIIATEDDTEILIYPRVDLEGGHNGLESYTITLDAGETYSGGVLASGDPNPGGTAIASNKPISVSVKDDSVAMPAGCRDLVGDQLVPVEITGQEYIVSKGALTTPDKLVITATENVTTVDIGGVYQTTLFAGQTYEHEINDPLTFVETNKPVYAFHITGFGCEIGGALLPPLNCAGSEQVSYTRSTADFFALNLLVRDGAQDNFEINGNATLILATNFAPVPGTGGEWVGAQISYNITDMPIDSAYQITNSEDVFAMGLINGGATSGCRFGYFSEFAAQIIMDAGANASTCSDVDYQLAGIITGGTTTGEWSTSGNGSFLPDEFDLDAVYRPSANDILNGSVTITLTSTGQCEPEIDTFDLTIVSAPVVDAGEDFDACSNNVAIALEGTVINATGGAWDGGDGLFSNQTNVSSTYSPTPAEIALGSLTLTLKSTGNGICTEITDEVTITFTPSPTANAGSNISVCSNNADVELDGSVSISGSGQWSGGDGSYDPSINALDAVYTPTQDEIDAGTLTLTLTTILNGDCNAVSDDVLITFTTAPTVGAGINQTISALFAHIV